MNTSSLYRGKIRHRRRTPVTNAFTYSAFMLCLDLSELDTVFDSHWTRRLWSTQRMALARFRRNDHFEHIDGNMPLDRAARQVLVENGVNEEIGQILLLTQVRYFGFEMNPVSFYYCYGDGEDRANSVVAIIAEVNNTPWGEQHVYVIKNSHLQTDSSADRPTKTKRKPIVANSIPKAFHVSPFMKLNQTYRMLFTPPEEQLGVKMQNFENGERLFDVSMLMERIPMTSWNLNWMLIRFPLMSVQIFLAIYWQALKLYLKGCPFIPHPGKTSQPIQSDVEASSASINLKTGFNQHNNPQTQEQSA